MKRLLPLTLILLLTFGVRADVNGDVSDEQGLLIDAKWVTQAQIQAGKAQPSAQQAEWIENAAPALIEYRRGRTHFAEAKIRASSILAQDARNPIALIIMGNAAYRTDDLTTATLIYRQLLKFHPDSVIGLNNLAILAAFAPGDHSQPNYSAELSGMSFRFSNLQSRPDEVIANYTRAIQLAPQNLQLLDNIAFAMEAYLNKDDPAFKKLSALYDRSQRILAPIMAKQKLYRWWATWVSWDELAARKTELTGIFNRQKKAQADLQSDTDEYNRINAEIQYEEGVRATLPDYEVGQLNSYSTSIAALGNNSTVYSNKMTADQAEIDRLQNALIVAHRKAYPEIDRIMEP